MPEGSGVDTTGVEVTTGVDVGVMVMEGVAEEL